ncbi:hypothetical protein [Rhizobium leguminosarum]|uniref:Sigma-70 family RNA polymerase sigma factor n=1 Tax=Rhizobium leguminosarum TaxID=384 RepID=A0A7M3DW78_RHILE|nr:hypothetical protein [Rhizobium leguminosarum]TAY52948.1 hypothetical protein ELH90_15590 [Rhizobium leguminosarum]
MDSQTEKSYRSIEEVKARFAYATAADIARLKKIARIYVDSSEVEELISLSQISLFSDRKWPVDVDFFAFMAMTMKSIASTERRKSALRQHLSVVLQHGDAADLCDIADARDTPEDLASKKSAYEATMEIFRNDDLAATFIEARVLGYNKQEVMDLCGVDLTGYDTIARRVRRKLEQRAQQQEAING